MKNWVFKITVALLFGVMVGCIGDPPLPPPVENEEEIITDVILSFDPANSSSKVIARAIDPDGEGPEDIVIVDDIILATGVTYSLAITFENSISGESITEEVEEEGEEHQIFFQWTDGAFSDPTGDGNFDRESDPVNYIDKDVNGLPIGLSTFWTAGPPLGEGNFRIVLKHQPDAKSSDSNVLTGDTDIDLIWKLVIQ